MEYLSECTYKLFAHYREDNKGGSPGVAPTKNSVPTEDRRTGPWDRDKR